MRIIAGILCYVGLVSLVLIAWVLVKYPRDDSDDHLQGGTL
jgi:hypothetical protein